MTRPIDWDANVTYSIVCSAHARGVWDFRPSEIVSDAISGENKQVIVNIISLLCARRIV